MLSTDNWGRWGLWWWHRTVTQLQRTASLCSCGLMSRSCGFQESGKKGLYETSHQQAISHLWIAVFVFYCCCKELSQTQWLKEDGIIIQEARRPTWLSLGSNQCVAGYASFWRLGKILFSCFFQLLEVTHGSLPPAPKPAMSVAFSVVMAFSDHSWESLSTWTGSWLDWSHVDNRESLSISRPLLSITSENSL